MPVLGSKSKFFRLISKRGATNISFVAVSGRHTKYFSDICTTLIDIKWRWNLILFFGVFTITWCLFAVYYYFLCYLHGDFFDKGDNWLPCITSVHSYWSAYLFSIETMTTIGYGSRIVTEACPGVYLGVIAQSIFGAALQFALAGLVVAKVRCAKKRSLTILFSNVACIYEEDLKLRLAIRVGDMRKSDIIGAHARAYCVRQAYSRSGDKIPVQYFSMDFRSEGGDSRLFLPWPTYIVHDIGMDSPLYNLSRDDVMNEHYELIVVLEGISSTLSNAFQVMKSYQPWEIRWGHRFKPLGLTYEDVFDEHFVDYEHFHETKAVSTPLVSAKEIDELSIRGELSTETLQRRRDSRAEVDLFEGHQKRSASDTYLGVEETQSQCDLFVESDTMSLQERLRKMSTMTYHGPGTFGKRKSSWDIFRMPMSWEEKERRRSTGDFLDKNRSIRKSSDVGSPGILRTRRSSDVNTPIVDKRRRPNVVDLHSIRSARSNINLPLFPASLFIGQSESIRQTTGSGRIPESEEYDDVGPRYLRKKKAPIVSPLASDPLRKRSEPSLGRASGAAAMQRSRRHSLWQFAEQDSFISSYKKAHPERYLNRLEVVESEDSEDKDSNSESESKEGDFQKERAIEGSVSAKKQLPEVRVVIGSSNKTYTVFPVPEDDENRASRSRDRKQSIGCDEVDAGCSSGSSSEEEETRGENSAHAQSTSCSNWDRVNLAYVYDSEDDIGYSRNVTNDVVDSDNESTDGEDNIGYEPDHREESESET